MFCCNCCFPMGCSGFFCFCFFSQLNWLWFPSLQGPQGLRGYPGMAGPKGETVSEGGIPWIHDQGCKSHWERSQQRPPLRAGPAQGWIGVGIEPFHAPFAGSCWLQGHGRERWSSRAAGGCPLHPWVPPSPLGALGSHFALLNPCFPLSSRARKAPRDHLGTLVTRESR